MKVTITVSDSLTGEVVNVVVTPEVKEVYEAGIRQKVAQEKQVKRHNDMNEFDENVFSDRISQNELLDLVITREEVSRCLEVIKNCSEVQSRRAYMHWVYGLSITEIANLQQCSRRAVSLSIGEVKKRIMTELKN